MLGRWCSGPAQQPCTLIRVKAITHFGPFAAAICGPHCSTVSLSRQPYDVGIPLRILHIQQKRDLSARKVKFGLKDQSDFNQLLALQLVFKA